MDTRKRINVLFLLGCLAVLTACTSPGELIGQLPTPSPVAAGTPGKVSNGIWGTTINGKAVQMLEVGDTATTVEFVCAHGLISQALTLDATGQFAVEGTYTQESGVAPADAALPVLARYTGRSAGPTMTLTVTLIEGAVKIGDYSLTYSPVPLPPLPKCM